MLSTHSVKIGLINDLVKNTCVLVVMHVLANQRAGKQLMNEESLYAILFFLAGIIGYWTVFINVLPPVV